MKCKGKDPSQSDKFTIDAIAVTRMSIQSFAKLVSIGSKSDDLHRANRTRRPTSSWVTSSFRNTFLVSGGFNTHERETAEREGNEGDFIYIHKES